ncbi:MAG: glutamine--tRNA ligase/YqeY domain fusion protein [Cyclobacteriaceae bacterium]|nr:glutamine--tRNA ligase/YqeY domain fusion protein [Cyclobacteriaceae bacterium]
MEENIEKNKQNFIKNIISEDLKNNLNNGKVITRFPPEPNGYLHIGHAKSICLNFGLAVRYHGACNLRFDDTNPETEETEYVESIKNDIHWLGFDWGNREYYASDYFDQLYEYAIMLINKGLAYVDDQSAERISATRGTPTQPGMESPFRNRSVGENLILFDGMKNGEFPDGSKVLRAKIDIASPNMHLRDPALYRIKKMSHHRTLNKWCIYPMYDFAHGQSDYIEGVTHSICTLEFEVHRPLYDWFLDHIAEGDYRPKQIEFARLNLNYTVMSKRRMLELVRKKYVKGWDDPRMPTISGLRRRGYTPESIRNFSERIGVARRDGIIDVALLEFSIREDLNQKAFRKMAVLDPLKVVLTNYPDGKVEMMTALNNPENEADGVREIPFSMELYIERGDFMEDPPSKYFRLSPGREVRLKYAYIIRCDEVIRDKNTGHIRELRCSYDPDTRSGMAGSQRKIKGTIHWISVDHSIKAEVRLYDRLFDVEDPSGIKDGTEFTDHINPHSLEVIENAYIEPSVKGAKHLDKFQFERNGYFCVDPDSTENKLIFNRTVTLRDTWARMQNNRIE